MVFFLESVVDLLIFCHDLLATKRGMRAFQKISNKCTIMGYRVAGQESLK